MKILENLTEKQLLKIFETLKDFKSLLSRYDEVKNDPKLLKLFNSRNRNPLFDLTQSKFWQTGLKSENAKNSTNSKLVHEHFYPRKLATGKIFEQISKNPNMELIEFVDLCKKYSSTVVITDEEHKLVTIKNRGTEKPSFLFYDECGIKIEGMNDYIKNLI